MISFNDLDNLLKQFFLITHNRIPQFSEKVRLGPKYQYRKPKKALHGRYKVALLDRPINKKDELISP